MFKIKVPYSKQELIVLLDNFVEIYKDEGGQNIDKFSKHIKALHTFDYSIGVKYIKQYIKKEHDLQ